MRSICIIFCILFSALATNAQLYGIEIVSGKKEVKVPFENYNNYLVFSVYLNETLPLKFILDSGAKSSILIHKEYVDWLNIPLERELYIYGADRTTKLKTFLARNINLTLEGLRAKRQSILVLDQDYFSFEKYLGIPIDGILGIDFFRRFIVKIDYEKNYIIFTEREQYKFATQKFEKIPLEIDDGYMYVKVPIKTSEADRLDTKLLLDTGSGLPLIVSVNRKDSLLIPKDVELGQVARGLGGFITGFSGRIENMDVGTFQFSNFVGTFQQFKDSLAIEVSLDPNWRGGILGNEILSRFSIIVDYNDSAIYLKPNKKYKKKFKYDKSGLFIIATGIGLSTYIVDSVVRDSPAEEAGIQKGDLIKKINGIPMPFYSLNGIFKKLKGKTGKKIKITLLRQGVKLKKTIVLRDLL